MNLLGSAAVHLSATVATSVMEKLPVSWRKPPDDEVQNLSQDLQKLRSSVLDLSKEDMDDSTLSTIKMSLKNQMQELCYDAEDYLEMVRHTRGGCSWHIDWILSKAKRQRPPLSAKDISNLRSRVKKTKEIAKAYRSASSSRTASDNDPRPQEEPGISRHVVYSDQPDYHDQTMRELVRMLALDSDQQLKTVAIHGSAGIGKTTLARRLYHDYGGRFNFKAFLPVSRNQDARMLLATMLWKLKGQGCCYGGFDDEQKLIANIRQHLQGKNYFVVIDDLRGTSVWDILSCIFPKDNCCSRIIITTQVREVALACCTYHKEDVFNMKPLNYDQSLQLFDSRVKHIKHYNDDENKKISEAIIGKCGHGLPLAIINIAGMLAGWPNFKINEWEYVRTCLFHTLAENPTAEEVMVGILNLMYNNLPTKLKTCLLYLSIYPEGSVIGKDDLVRQWVAEGILCKVEGQGEESEGILSDEEVQGEEAEVNPTDVEGQGEQVEGIHSDEAEQGEEAEGICIVEGQGEEAEVLPGDVEEQGEEAEGIISVMEGQDEELAAGYIYFDELLKRGLIQPVDTDYNNQVLSFIVHHVVLDFITMKSMQENFITFVDYRETVTGLPENKVHRLSVRFERAKSAQIPQSFNICQVRSFMFSGFVKSVPSLVNYCLLRVLVLHIWSDQDKQFLILYPIGKMFQLRYLKVESKMIVKLPVMIGGLRHLQTLHVDAETVVVPQDVFSLKNLLHLRLPKRAHLPGPEIHDCLGYVLRTELLGGHHHPFFLVLPSVLRTLFSNVNGIGNLTSLQSLGYIDLSTCSRGTVAQIGELTNLLDLHLTCSAVPSSHRNSNINCLASVLGKCTNLKSLIICGEASSNQSISFDGLCSLSSPPANVKRLVLSPSVFKMSRLPGWIRQLSMLSILEIAVGDLSPDDVDILKGLDVLTALSLYVRSTPENESWIIFSEGFQSLKYFKFTCTALRVKFSEGTMPAVQRLNVCFNAYTMQQYRPEDAGIGYLSGVKVISAKIGAAGADQASREATKARLMDAILTNHPSLRCLEENHLQSRCLKENHPKPPISNVQMVDWVIHGDTEESSADVMKPENAGSLHCEKARSFLSEFPLTRRALLPSIFTRRGQDLQHKIEEKDVVEKFITRESSLLMQKPGWVTRRPGTGVRLVKTVRGFTYMVRQHMKQPGFDVMNEMASINQEMRRMTIMTDSNPGMEPPELVWQVQDLAYDVQDFSDMYSWLRIKSRRHALAHMSHIVQLKDRIRSLREWQQKGCISSKDRGSGVALSCLQTSGPYAPEDVLVGMDQPRNELLKLIFESEVMDEVSPWFVKEQKPRAVSIVGCIGIGKTALARTVYYDPCVRSAFNCVAWVVASECSHGADLLNKICQQVEEQTDDAVPDFYVLKEFLRNKRFLIVIDDLHEAGMWYDIKGVFGENHNGSRIILTTSIQSVATGCTPEPQYIYKMQSLNILDSEKLLWVRVSRKVNRTPALEYALGDTLKKCGGLPLALISVANHLCQRKGNLTEGAIGVFEEMDRVLTKCYESLPDNAHRMCLLSLSTFPQGHVIKRKRLIRRWIAEGLAVGDSELSAEQVASNRFDVLIDRNIIEPVLIGNNSKVKACLVLGVIKDFIIKKTVSKEIATIIQNDELLLPNKMISHPVRRLFVHGGTTHSEGVAKGIGLDQVRSLTICDTVPFDFQGCWLLRVLDLEACQRVDKLVLGNICKLVFLKYLSLRSTDVYKISKKIEKLEYLETLDLRDTRVEALPIEVFMLPRLVHLFGKFALPRQLKSRMSMSRLQAFFSEKSRLQTLSGYVMVDNNSFDIMMITIRSLRKIKVWCKHSISSYQEGHLASSLQKRLVGNNTLESLSIDFGNESIDFLNDIGAPYAVTGSMKLQGRLTSLPSFMTSYDTTLSKLQLSSTGLGIEALSLLQKLRRLIFLQLVQDGDGFSGDCFVVNRDGFPSLLRLCIEARELPQLHIHEGGMSSLISLELLCPLFTSCDYSDLGEMYVDTYSEKSVKEVHSVENLKAVDTKICFKDIGSSRWSTEVDPSISFNEFLLENKHRINYPQKVQRRFDLRQHFKGMEHLQCLNELVLHPSVSDEVLDDWKEQASCHINRPKVTRQCTSALSLSRGPRVTNYDKEEPHTNKPMQTRGSEAAVYEKAKEHSSGLMSRGKEGFEGQTSDKGKKIQEEEEQQLGKQQGEEGKILRAMDSLPHLVQRIQGMICALTQKMMLHKCLINHNYEYIRGKLGMMAAYLGDGLSQNSQLVPPEKWVLQLQDLVYDIEDFEDMYNYMSVRSHIHALPHLSHIEDLKVRIENLHRQRRLEYIQSTKPCRRDDSAPLSKAVSRSHPLTIGMDEQIRELLELVRQEELDAMDRVISIVGCPGVGKSTLAEALRNQKIIMEMFDESILVPASECRSIKDLKNRVIQEASNGHPPTTREGKSIDMNLNQILPQKRFLIIIDDLGEIVNWVRASREWAEICRYGQIIVTTSIQSVASSCSPVRKIYRMKGLGHLESEYLFLRTAYGDAYPTVEMADALEEASRRCEGLPLALISVAHVWHEQEQGWPEKWGSYKPPHPLRAFEKLYKRFSRWYQSLPDATFMLSLAIFPNGHSIKRKSLIRRWIAEGLIHVHHDQEHHDPRAENVGEQLFDELINQSIVEPVRTGSTNSKVKRCRLQAPVLEFIIKESVSKNIVTLLRGDELLSKGRRPHPARVLSVHQTTETSGGRVATEIGFDHLRSLIIFNNGVAFDLQRYTYLRVLDLECCKGVDHRVVAGICKLVLLRYLSLRGSDVEVIPKEIGKLECIETLDIRETAVKKLPLEAIMLPQLFHLFGQFELPQELGDRSKRSKLEKFFQEESKLQTLSGLLLTDMSNGYEHIALHPRLLSKIKIWCKHDTFWEVSGGFMSSLQELLREGNRLKSLSIDFGHGHMGEYLSNSESIDPMLRSIKLRGRLGWPLPCYLTSSYNYHLSELQLSSTGLTLKQLSVLKELPQLFYLKLAEDGEGFPDDTIVEWEGFPCLKKLCFEAPKLPLVRVVQGAMPALTSLHLLCPESDDEKATSETQHGTNPVWEIEYLERLNDLVLHYSVGDKELNFWNEKAKRHVNRPKVSRQAMMP